MAVLIKTLADIKREGREISEELIKQIVEVNKLAWGSEKLGGNYRQIRSRANVFPEGQFIAFIREGNKSKLVGVLHSLRIQSKGPKTGTIPREWDKATANGYFTNHDPKGNTLLCVSIAVHPAYLGKKRAIGAKMIAKAIEYGEKNGIEYPIPYSRTLYGKPTGKILEKRQKLKEDIGREATIEEHIKLGDPIARFHMEETEHKPGADLAEILENARTYDKKGGGHCVLFHYTKDKIDAWKERKKPSRRKLPC